MNRFLFTIALIMSYLASMGCAAIAPQYDDQDFVPRKDLRVVHLVREGLDYYARSRYVEAEARLRQGLYLQPDLENVRLSLAVVLENQGLFDEALEQIDQLVSERPDYVKYLLAKAHIFLSAGRYREAVRFYEKAFQLAADDPGENFGVARLSIAQSLSVLAFRIGLEEEALCYSQAALTVGRTPINTARHIRLLNAMGYHKTAIAALGVGEDGTLVSQDPLILTQAAMAYFSLEKYDDAIRLSERALESLTIDAQGETEMKLLQSIVAYLEEKKNPFTEEELEELSSDERSEREERITYLSGNLAYSTDAFYWPFPLISHLASAQSEIEASGVLDEKGLFGKALDLMGISSEPDEEESSPSL